MMAVIIGADHLGGMEKKIRSYGITEIEHITGRNPANQRKFNIPKSANVILVMIDYVNHNTALMVKQQAKALAIPLIFANRSWCSLEKKIQEFTARAS
ncbi:MAG TPA: DUF2325 domain-containing protein [Patescibacteria group bacterium]|nr:DUF2325 domain-containing protein [Patescibacteria group bacterium]